MRGGKPDEPMTGDAPVEGPGFQMIVPTADHHETAALVMDEVVRATESADIEKVIAHAIAVAEARGARGSIGGNNPPPDLVPEKLVDPDVLPDLFAKNYPAMVERGKELEAAIGRWKALHLVPRPADWPEGKAWPERYAVPDDVDNGKTSNFVRLLTSFAGGKSAASGEVNEARERVKGPIIAAGKTVDGWFGSLRDSIRTDMLLMDRAQIEYLQAKAAAEQRKRDADAAAALELANRKAAEAAASGGDDEKVEEAIQAEAKADDAVRGAEQTPTEMTRQRTAEGTTTSLGGKWVAKVVDLMVLVKAVAENRAPLEFLSADASFITRAVQAKKGTISYPGIEISQEAKLNRSGRTS